MIDIECSDGNVCNGVETCTAGRCQPGIPPTCADDDPCTDDNCAPESGCSFDYNTAPCDDGIACTSGDSCALGTCVGTDTCPNGQTCDASSGDCVAPAVWIRAGSDPTLTLSGAMAVDTQFTDGTDVDPAADNLTTPLLFANSTANNFNGLSDDHAVYTFDLPAAGLWYAWGRMYFPDAAASSANSFWIAIDGGAPHHRDRVDAEVAPETLEPRELLLGLDRGTLGGRAQPLRERPQGGRLGRRHRISYGYFSLSRNSNLVLDEEIQFGDEIFPVNAVVESDFRTQFAQLGYSFSFLARDKIEARRRRDHERAERATLKFVASAATAAKRGASVSQQHSSTTPSPNHHPPHRAPLTHAAAFADLTAVSAYSLCHGVSLREGLDQWSHVLSQAAAESAPFRPEGVGCMMRQRRCGEVNLHELHMS